MISESNSKDVLKKLERIEIKTTLPGPEAKKVIGEDSEYLAKSTKSMDIVAKRGQGVFVEDVDGNVFIDFASGIGVTNLGHVHPYVTEKVREQLNRLWHFAGTDFYYREQVKAAKALSEITPGKFSKKTFFTNSGAESNEAAIKIAKASTGKHQFIAFIGAFHGRTMGALSLTASKPVQKKGFFPSMPGVEHVPFPNPYRNPFGIDGYENPDELVDRTIDFIEKYAMNTYVPGENAAAFVVEPIQGEGGYIVPPKSFHKRLRKLADDNDMLVIMDEVQTGFGRTGRFFASEHFEVEPQMISLAKAISNGIPMGAVVIDSKLDFPEQGRHSNTFGGNLLASASCIASVEAIKKEHLLENATRQGNHLKKRLQEMQEKYDAIGDVRGIGLMLAADFVKDRRTREPNVKLRDAVEKKAFENGMIVLPTGVSAIRFIPPLIITEEQVDMGVDALEKAIKASL